MSPRFYERFLEILDNHEKQTLNLVTKLETYDSPAWSHKQAHLNGARQEIVYLRKLINSIITE